MNKLRHKKVFFIASVLALLFPMNQLYATQSNAQIASTEQQKQQTKVRLINPTTVEICNSKGERMTIDFYGSNIIRLFQDNAGGMQRDPQATPEATILVPQPRQCPKELVLVNDADGQAVISEKIKVFFDPETFAIKVQNRATNKVVFEQLGANKFGKKNIEILLKSQPDEYFFGGGVQNGRFSHKGQIILAENTSSWTDGGVCSPAPFYWSTNGYAVMFHTFKKGKYDFGATKKDTVILSHDTNYLDLFVMVDENAVDLLNDYYQLTGNPALLPKFGFYEGHLNAYNRDYWKAGKEGKGMLFNVDGEYYRESQNDNGGIKESLNGENNNYKFSARAVIDRYSQHDMPLGWLLPNDGYGAGYGQTSTIDGNIANLKALTDYAQKKGVEVGLWTQSSLHPRDSIEVLLQRDIVKEVRDAGVRVLKTDVAWVGPGYSFGLNGISDASQIMTYYGNNARPFIITLNGWAGTQRYAGVWTGDQSGGQWEYIRFHIPTYICSGLSGIPNISSDMDGIFGGSKPIINVRDFQWKTFTPMELNMDGWGDNAKYPHIFDEPYTSINRWYLKMKAEMMPYTYTIAKEAVNGKPIIRAMFLDYPNSYTLGKATQYQFLYGPSFLIAPIYKETAVKENGDDIRNGIYLPEGIWYDYFTGNKYEGNRIINNFDAPIWKLPIFVKAGSIIPMTNPNNNVAEIRKDLRIYEIYPGEKSSFNEYDDDGLTEEYRYGAGTTTLIEAVAQENKAIVTVHPTQGTFRGFVKEKVTEFRINVTKKPQKVQVKVGKKTVKLTEVSSLEDFLARENVYFYNAAPNLNQFATPGSDFAQERITKNPQAWVKVAKSDVTTENISLALKGYEFTPSDLKSKTGILKAPKAQITEGNITPYTLTPTWEKISNADYYEIEFEGQNYSTIKECSMLFEDLKAITPYNFKIRSVNKEGASDWSAFNATTLSDPLEFAIRGIKAMTSCKNQGGHSVNNLFDFDENKGWHTEWSTKATPFDMIIDLKSINTIEKLHYLPREDAGNGTLLKGQIYYSNDQENWIDAGSFEWARDNQTKVFIFEKQPTVRYLKISVEKGVGNFGSGNEMYIFKMPQTPSYLPGDINNDRLVDQNDFTSYMNYVGLRQGDGDFEGYISNGDLNKNGLIDAYDISSVATQLEEDDDEWNNNQEKITGNITLTPSKKVYNAGETVEITVKGIDLKAVNAISFCLPYNSSEYDFVSIEPVGMLKMENISRDRLHSNGNKAYYPTFVNFGNKKTLEGTSTLFIIKLRAKANITYNLQATDGLLVSKQLRFITF